MAALTQPAGTVILMDGSYYGALPVNPPAIGTFTPTGFYLRYWKNIGNSYLFRWVSPTGPAMEPSDAEAVQLGKSRHSGVINVQFADGHTKAVAYDKLISDVTMWNPYQQ